MAALQLRPAAHHLGSNNSSFRGSIAAFKSLSRSQNVPRPRRLTIVCATLPDRMAGQQVMPAAHVYCSNKSSFCGLTAPFKSLSISTNAPRPRQLTIVASRKCPLTGKRANNGYVVTFSHKRIKKLQQVNLQYKKVFWPAAQRWVKMRVSTKALKIIDTRGLEVLAKEAGINLWKLPFEDRRPARRAWRAARTEFNPPMAKNPRRMKNPEKLAASRKTPLMARYVCGKIVMVRSPRAPEPEGGSSQASSQPVGESSQRGIQIARPISGMPPGHA